MSNKFLKTFCAAWVGLASAACGTADQQQVEADELMTSAEAKDGIDIQQALTALPGTQVLGTHEKDGVPSFIKGNFGVATGSARGLAPVDAKATVQEALAAVAPAFRLNASDLVFKRVNVDENGNQHLRFQQTKGGLEVVNGQLILHVDARGVVYAANGDARDAKPGVGIATLAKPQISADAAALSATKATLAMNKSAKAERVVYVRDTAGELVLAHQIRVTGTESGGMPVEDLVYVNAANGKIALRAPQVYTALNRAVYSANNGTSLPGTLKRSEGGAASNDAHVDGNYTKLGNTYNCYSVNFARDSFNNAGAQLKSTVHYSSNYVNAYWNSSQMVYGDGNGTDSGMLGLSGDVTTHELTHAVTEYESNLTYSGESGGINEAMSDIFGAYCQSWEEGWTTTNSVFMVGDDIWTPATPNDALRYMYDPKADGSSLDFWTSSAGSVDVHYSSGIANLAFTLLSRGGTHPRGKSTVVVPAIGVEKAGKIYYYANRDYLTASSNYAALKTALQNAAGAAYPGDSAVLDAVTKSMEAVGVGVVVPPPPTVTLSNGVPVTGIGDSSGAQRFYKLTVPASQTTLTFTTSGGTGDVDLYTNFGSAPTTSTYACRPYASGNAETCTHSSPSAGDWYVMLNAYSTYSGVTLTGTYSGGGGGGSVLTNGVATAPYSGAASAFKCFTLQVPSGKTSVVFNQVGASGTTGDADLYVRYNAAPTTSTYNCRPYLSGNTETCTISNPSAGTWYACSRGYSAYTNVTMKGTY